MKIVYFVQAGPMIKIGCTGNMANRLQTLSAWNPYPLTLLASHPGDGRLERSIQAEFEESHSHGEWYHVTDRLLGFIESVKRGEMPPLKNTGRVMHPSYVTGREKSILTHTVTRAERRRYGSTTPYQYILKRRPEAVTQALKSYIGPFASITPEARETILAYAAELDAIERERSS